MRDLMIYWIKSQLIIRKKMTNFIKTWKIWNAYVNNNNKNSTWKLETLSSILDSFFF